MSISANLKQVQKYYHGTSKVYQGGALNIIPIDFDSNWIDVSQAAILIDETDNSIGYLAGWFHIQSKLDSGSHSTEYTGIVGTIKTSKKIKNVVANLQPLADNNGRTYYTININDNNQIVLTRLPNITWSNLYSFTPRTNSMNDCKVTIS